LSVAFCDIPDFVADHFPGIVPFSFANQFALQGADTARDVGAWDEYKHLELLETAYLIMTTGDPILPFRRSEGFMPLRFILQVRFEGSVRNRGHKIWHGSSVCGCDVKGKEIM
jgi:hypothetical protein